MARIERPVELAFNQDRFNDREVGITHPDTSSFIRCTDTGDIEIFAAPGVGIILSANNGCVTIVADQVKFMTKEKNGLRWNKLAANPNGYKFTEPPWVPFAMDDAQNLFDGISEFTE